MQKGVQLSNRDRCVISSILISSLIQLAGCGPPRALKASPDEKSKSNLRAGNFGDPAENNATQDGCDVPMSAEQLGLKVLFGRTSPDGRPEMGITTIDPTLKTPCDHEMRAGRNQICSSSTLRLRGSEELYFVWSEGALGSTVIHAEYTHHVLSSGNQWRFNQGVTSATLDRRSHQWHISISNILRSGRVYLQERVRDADTQFLNLDLTLANSKIISIEISFTASDPERP